MAKMPGLLRQRQKIDEAELERDQQRMAARLADIFGGSVETDPVDPPEADAPAEAAAADPSMITAELPEADAPARGKRRGRRRPAIAVQPGPPDIGATVIGDESALVNHQPDDSAMVGVMAGPGSAVAAGPGAEWWSAAVDYALIGGAGIADTDGTADPDGIADVVGVADADGTLDSDDASHVATLDGAPGPIEADEAVPPEAVTSPQALANGAVDAPPAAALPELGVPAKTDSSSERTGREPAKRRSTEPRSRTEAKPGAEGSRSAPARASGKRPSSASARPGGDGSRSAPARASGKRPSSASARRARPGKAASKAVAVASCPYCAVLLDPPPTSSRGCPRCRNRVVVKRIEGRVVYLTEASVAFFEAERRRIAGAARFTRERARWLKLAAAAGAPPERGARLVAAQLSEETVDAARALYTSTVERAFRTAKRERRWEDASRIRRDQAMAIFRLPGSGSTPSETVLALHREGVAAELRGLAEIAKEAELVSAACCDTCRADDGRVGRIAQELLAARLPHPGCPKGLCRCRWHLTAHDQTILRRYQRRPARPNPRASQRAVTSAPQPAV